MRMPKAAPPRCGTRHHHDASGGSPPVVRQSALLSLSAGLPAAAAG